MRNGLRSARAVGVLAVAGALQVGAMTAGSAPALAEAAPAKSAGTGGKNYTTTHFVYRTFITDKYVGGAAVKACAGTTKNWKFGGDNRSYSTSPTASHRTYMGVVVHWKKDKFPHIEWGKSAGKTKLYNEKNKLIRTKTASTADMRIPTRIVSKTKVKFTIDHSATNPHCPTIGGAIKYKIAVTLNRNGSWYVSGWRRPVPNHESYIWQDKKAPRWILRHGNKGFHCLTGVCKNDKINIGGKS
ncbi:DUF3238 domain-containing protein [Spirillospora sp. CA-294931]|uniref:DUF3238 domain-containing protein n=1 Tax=Spirillospora sp. CA-294931 TaxID=3240042 RepID=UPI003D8FA1E6